MGQRLPIVNADDGTWGTILRDYLLKEHTDDGNINTTTNGGHQHITITGGTATAGTAPITFTSGTLNTTPQTGAMEFAGDFYYLTDTSGPTRRKIAAYDDTSGAEGDIYYRNSTGYFTRLPRGSGGDFLTVSGNVPAWTASIPNTASITVKDANFTIQDNTTTSKQLQFELSGITASTTRTLTVPDADTTIVGTDTIQTLINKTLTSPKINSIVDSSNVKIVELTGVASAENWLEVTNQVGGGSPAITAKGTTDTDIDVVLQPKGAGAVTIAMGTGQSTAELAIDGVATDISLDLLTKGTGTVKANGVNVVTSTGTQTLTSKTLDNTNTVTIKDTNFTIQDDGNSSKQLKFQLSGLSAVTRTLTPPDADTTLLGMNTATAKGDIYVATASNAVTRLGVGTDNWVLTADSSQATGVKWAAAAGGIGGTSGSTDNAVLRADGTGGSTVQSSGVTIDDNAIISANTFKSSTFSTTTSGGTLTMDGARYEQVQIFTGSSTHTVKLPTTGLVAGQAYTIINQSSGDVTVQSSNASTLNILKGGSSSVYVAKIATPNTAADWYSRNLQGSRVNTTTSSATPSINSDTTDQFNITSLATNITSMTSGLSGTPVDGQMLMIRITSDSTARTITWGTSFQSSGIATLPATTVASKTHHVGLVYDAAAAKWTCIAVDGTGY